MKDNGIFQAVKIALTKAVSTSPIQKKTKNVIFCINQCIWGRFSELCFAFSAEGLQIQDPFALAKSKPVFYFVCNDTFYRDLEYDI